MISITMNLPVEHAGKGVPACSQEIVLDFSSSVHLSVVPSVQFLTCFIVPSPQVGSSPVPSQFPLFSHAPWVLGVVANKLEGDDLFQF